MPKIPSFRDAQQMRHYSRRLAGSDPAVASVYALCQVEIAACFVDLSPDIIPVGVAFRIAVQILHVLL